MAKTVNWGVFENEGGTERHVLPMIVIDGDSVASAAHIMSRNCDCRPKNIQDGSGDYAGPIWNHNDPDHPGANPS